MSPAFTLGREQVTDGRFVRQPSAFRERITADGSSGFPAEAGRYHLYVALACPWSHRTVIVRRLKRLEDVIGVSYVDPYRDDRGWAFTGGPFVDDVNGFEYLSEAYDATDPAYEGRVSVPVLWDRETGRIVSNESAGILRMFELELDAFGDPSVDLYPEPLRAEIELVNDRVYETVNNGVYRAGFATGQRAYEEAFAEVFASLDWLEGLLGERRYAAGDAVTEADWRLFCTLVRFDAVYHHHFKCNRNRLVDFPRLWAYTRELYQRSGIAQTVDFEQIKRHYYTTHGHINPTGVIPAGPELDFAAPHGR